MAAEGKTANRTLRHLLYGHKPHIYWVIHDIDKRSGAVYILAIRHGARDRGLSM